MIGLLQRVRKADVVVEGEQVGAIGPGLMVLVCAERGDTVRQADALLTKLLSYRVFADDAGKMNRSVTDVQGGLLLVPQFTLAADTDKGTRAGFSRAEQPDAARALFSQLVEMARAHGLEPHQPALQRAWLQSRDRLHHRSSQCSGVSLRVPSAVSRW